MQWQGMTSFDETYQLNVLLASELIMWGRVRAGYITVDSIRD